MFKFLILGFIVNFVTSFDDVVSRIPILTSVARKRMGRIAFSTGNALAVVVAVMIALSFSAAIQELPNFRLYVTVLLLFFAVAVYFSWFESYFTAHTRRHLQRTRGISSERFFKLAAIGFAVSFILILDDVVALTPLFLSGLQSTIFALIGIAAATLVQIVLVVLFAERLEHVPYRKEIASGSLVVLAILVFSNVL